VRMEPAAVTRYFADHHLTAGPGALRPQAGVTSAIIADEKLHTT
jgi:hypothetical protein